MRSRQSYEGLSPNALITRADVAVIADVHEETVQAWAQDREADPPFPAARPAEGGGQVAWHRIGEVIDWLCRTGRVECDLTDGLLNLEEAAAHLGVSPMTVKVWRRKGIFPDPDLILARAPYWSPEKLDVWEGRPVRGGNVRAPREFVPPPVRPTNRRRGPAASASTGVAT